MFEKYPMIHYEFNQQGSGIQEMTEPAEGMPENISEKLNPLAHSDYRLRGYVDVLPVFPQAEDDFFQYLHLQSFSHMYSRAGYFTSRQAVQSFLLVHTVSGNGKLEYNGTVCHLKTNDIFWIDCRQPHTYMTEGVYWEHTDIHLGGTLASLLYREFTAEGSCVMHTENPSVFLNDIFSMLDQYLSLEMHRNMRISHRIETLLVHLILEKNRSESDRFGGIGGMETLISYMHEHFREPLTLDQLSDFCGISKYHLSRQFKKSTGLPPNEYLIRLRLENARTLLINTDLTVSKIAEMSGFENEAYFSRIFRSRFDVSPKQYRRQNRTAKTI